MRSPRSLQARLALSLGVLLSLLRIAAASVTALLLRHEMDEVFDSALQETAPRLLPLAVVAIVGREDDGVTQRLGAVRAHDAFLSYIVRDADGRVLLQSLAGAIAQAQRLPSETREPAALARPADIEATLKRLARVSERFMQPARAEDGQRRLDRATDLSAVARVMVDDLARNEVAGRVAPTLPEGPAMSDPGPVAFGILRRNLVQSALRHGAAGLPVEVTLMPDGRFSIANEGPIVPPETLARLAARFERAGADSDGSGVGLAMVVAIADRIDSPLVARSPGPGARSGYQASVTLPTEVANTRK
ncbi:sensor histidine kinase [Paracoccus salsus]|uniref:sensor histidine kinase n=1 Tax=Paracoccus salsus TaxID=2911061 RepID=UPI001F2ADFC3|nr:ATP-binding protein [Paracoccus salsus]MCF3972331.1 hypothetical protein [Paracoccus salsus]